MCSLNDALATPHLERAEQTLSAERNTAPPMRIIGVWLAVCAALITFGALSPVPVDASPVDPSTCVIGVSPYRGAADQVVWAQHGITLHRFTKLGLAPMYVATADAMSALPEPIIPAHVATRVNAKTLITGSRALVGVNGDFFRLAGDGTANGPEVLGGNVVKGTSRVQNVAVTTRSGRLAYGQMRAEVQLWHGTARYIGSGINDNSQPAGGLTVFTPQWGAVEPMRSSGAWREYVVSHGVIVAEHSAGTGARIPAGGYVVEAAGVSATHLQVDGWRVGAHVVLRTYIRSTVTAGGGVWAAIGAGSQTIHLGRPETSGCGYDTPTARTSIGVFAGGRKAALAATSNGRGLTQREMTAFLRSIGLTEAFSMDGGGSTALATHTHRWTVPRYGADRGVPNGFGFVPR